MAKWAREEAAHLLRRAGFGAAPKDVDRASRRGRKRTVKDMVSFRASGAHYKDKEADQWGATRWWLRRMLDTRSPLQEKLVLFWHGHFATAISKVENAPMMSRQNGVFRKHAAGSFRDLVQAVSRDPAMLWWLDNHYNVKGRPNENYARELMELFTLGITDPDGAPNYTEEDVREAARAFTGWSFADGKFEFYDYDHDYGTKTVLGLTGDLDGDDVVDHLVVRRACAQFVATKLWEFFAYPSPEREVVERLADVYLANDTEIRPVLEAMFQEDLFYSARARTERVSSPVEFAVATLRTLGTKTDEGSLTWRLSQMGQELYNPPNVAGWPGGLQWMNSVTRLNRMGFTWDVLLHEGKDADFRTDIPRVLTGLPKSATAAEVVDHVLTVLGPVQASAATRAELATWLDTEPDGDPQPFVRGDLDSKDEDRRDRATDKLRGLVGIVLTLPEAYLA